MEGLEKIVTRNTAKPTYSIMCAPLPRIQDVVRISKPSTTLPGTFLRCLRQASRCLMSCLAKRP